MRRKRPGTRRPAARFFSLKALLWGFLAFMPLAGGETWLSGRVMSVADGDTLTVYHSLGRTERVRLYGIDCPEYGQPGGAEATAFTRARALFQRAGLAVMDRDRFGRIVAVITLEDGRVLNEELLRNGHAWLYARHCKSPHCRRWQGYEDEARAAGTGLWSARAPVPPWKWRRDNKQR